MGYNAPLAELLVVAKQLPATAIKGQRECRWKCWEKGHKLRPWTANAFMQQMQRS